MQQQQGVEAENNVSTKLSLETQRKIQPWSLSMSIVDGPLNSVEDEPKYPNLRTLKTLLLSGNSLMIVADQFPLTAMAPQLKMLRKRSKL